MKQKKKSTADALLSPAPAAVIEAVRHHVEPLCADAGYDLVHCEFQREPAGAMLRLYIDKPGGVSLDDCVQISRHVSDLLDAVLDEGIGPYHLEVSSPGTDRPISRPVDFQRFAGHPVRVKVAKAIGGRKHFTGRLAGMVDGRVALELGDATVTLALEDIVRAR
ncbi:MAG: ribosome maturation factor RimP, partial [Desulfobacteraceae bacterium]|nr:ribosome maturation factor RimP [Desulfobacteraceae bacterium]